MNFPNDLFRGKLVWLDAFNSETDPKEVEKFNEDGGFQRLASSGPVAQYHAKAIRDFFEKETGVFTFSIRTLAENKYIGGVDLNGVDWVTGNAWVGIGIGDRDYWSNGYGTEAMRLILRFAFTQLNLHRVSLNLFAYNTRAMRSYEKCGFKHEGVVEGWMLRGGKRHDLVYMGILRSEWDALPPDLK